jgi:hypothetical protein
LSRQLDTLVSSAEDVAALGSAELDARRRS